MKTIDKIKNVDNTVIKSLVAINDGTSASVDYASTIFGSFEGFQNAQNSIEGALLGSQQKALVNTPLIPEQGNDSKLYAATKDHGVGFGLIFIDYKTKDPKLVVVVDGSSYSSASLQKDGSFKNRTASLTFASVNELISAAVAELSTDVNAFKGQ